MPAGCPALCADMLGSRSSDLAELQLQPSAISFMTGQCRPQNRAMGPQEVCSALRQLLHTSGSGLGLGAGFLRSLAGATWPAPAPSDMTLAALGPSFLRCLGLSGCGPCESASDCRTAPVSPSAGLVLARALGFPRAGLPCPARSASPDVRARTASAEALNCRPGFLRGPPAAGAGWDCGAASGCSELAPAAAAASCWDGAGSPASAAAGASEPVGLPLEAGCEAGSSWPETLGTALLAACWALSRAFRDGRCFLRAAASSICHPPTLCQRHGSLLRRRGTRHACAHVRSQACPHGGLLLALSLMEQAQRTCHYAWQLLHSPWRSLEL